jgi:hypothetical protein
MTDSRVAGDPHGWAPEDRHAVPFYSFTGEKGERGFTPQCELLTFYATFRNE